MINAEAVYDELVTVRDPYLRRARACSDLVAPELIPPEGADGNTEFTRLFDSTGAQGLQSLVSKTLQVVFPTDRAFIRMEPTAIKRASIIKEMGSVKDAKEALDQLESSMMFAEKAVLRRYVTTHLDAHMPNVFRHVYTAGNVLLHITENGRPKVHGMHEYVVHRDHLGDPQLGIIKEMVDIEAVRDRISPEALKQFEDKNSGHNEPGAKGRNETRLPLYTVVERVQDGKAQVMRVHQQVLSEKVKDTDGTFPVEESPFIFVWTQPVSGQHWGYSYVHTNYDDLVTLDELTENLTDIAAAAAVLRWIVKRGGFGALSLRKLHDMRNGAYLYGDPDALTPITLQGKISDMALVENRIQDIKGRLREAFLMFGAARRDAERVTAFENAQVMNELQSNLSSFFGPLAPMLQDRLAKVMLAQMRLDGSLPRYEDGFVEPVIITGSSALARETTTQAFLNGLGVISNAWTPVMEKYAHFKPFVAHVMEGLSASTPKGLWKTPEEIAKENEQRSIEAATPEIVKQAGKLPQ